MKIRPITNLGVSLKQWKQTANKMPVTSSLTKQLKGILVPQWRHFPF